MHSKIPNNLPEMLSLLFNIVKKTVAIYTSNTRTIGTIYLTENIFTYINKAIKTNIVKEHTDSSIISDIFIFLFLTSIDITHILSFEQILQIYNIINISLTTSLIK